MFCSSHSTASCGFNVSIAASRPAITSVRLLIRLSASSGHEPWWRRMNSRKLRTDSGGQISFKASGSHKTEMPQLIHVLSRRSGLILTEPSSDGYPWSDIQIKKLHLFLGLRLVLSEPIPVDRSRSLRGKPDFLRASMLNKPIYEFRCGGMRREVWVV